MSIVYNGELDKRTAKEIFASVIPELCQSDPDVI